MLRLEFLLTPPYASEATDAMAVRAVKLISGLGLLISRKHDALSLESDSFVPNWEG